MTAEMPRVRVESVRLRPTVPGDVAALYELQSDPEANRMAGTKPRTREAFLAAWERIFADAKVNARVIEVDGEVVGGVNSFQAPAEGRAAPGTGGGEMRDCVGYWIARAFWGRGVASRAVAMFLEAEETRRPLHATAARANVASIRVLEKCGFRCTGYRMGEETERYVACEVGEFVLG
jgi:RimJ/RimL family protein N-acetyltransferase